MIAHAEGTIGPALAWEPAPAVIVAAAVALVLYARGHRRLRRRGRPDLASRWRAALFGAAVLAGLLAVTSPLHAAGESYLLSAHMLQHVVIGDLVPALVLVALRGPLLFHVVPLASVRGRLRSGLDLLLRPAVSFGLWAANLALWHVPAVYELAARNELAHSLEHAGFVGTGFLVWAQLIDPARRRALTPQRRVAFACLVFVAGQALVNTLIISSKPLYPLYASQPERLFGLSPQADQQAGALTMMLEQLLTLGTFVALRIRLLLREPLVLASGRHPFTA